MMDEHLQSILTNTQGIPVSLNTACKILHKGKVKVRSLVGTKIGIVEGVDNNTYPLNLADVLRVCGYNI